jgi:chromate reductase
MMLPVPRSFRFLAISGSLRRRSISTELLRATALLAPPGIRLIPFDGLADLPHFNPDLDTQDPPAPVRHLRECVALADGVLICSPEYAHGVPGALKNALDWLVGGSEIVAKPVGLLNPSPRSVHAQGSLVEILRTISAELIPGALVTVPLLGRKLDAAGITADAGLAGLLRGAMSALADAVECCGIGAADGPFPRRSIL